MKSLSFVIPVYNEAKRIQKTFKALEELQLPAGLKLKEIIFVNDGSTDTTELQIRDYATGIIKTRHARKTSRHSKAKPKNLMRSFANAQVVQTQRDNKQYTITLVTYRQNQGKGYAIKQGMLASTADYTLFFDADMSTPLSQIEKFMPFIKKNLDVIIGTRKNGQSTVLNHQPYYRELLGRGFTKLSQIVLNVQVTDFTCGFKAFSKQANIAIFSKAKVNRWGYDAEILFLANRMGFSMVEKAVTWSNDENTKVNLYKAVPQTLADLAYIRFTHTIKPFLYQAVKTLRVSYNVIG